MDSINFIQDLAVVLLAAGFAGVLCKRIGLSVIVGYLAAGIAIGPYTPPFSFITDVDRIQTLSQVGLVFLMFAIGLGLSLSKLGRMGLPTLLATGLGAFLVVNLTQVLGHALGWSALQSLFVAGMFVSSSSAVIGKVVSELNLTHEGSAQRALSITVMEDVVAVVMLTVLASQVPGAGGESGYGSLIATMSAFVALLVVAGLVLLPRLFRRLEARADPELQTIIVAGVLFLLAISAAKAGYSLALGAFLLGAIVAEMPQKGQIERSFSGMRDLFSSVFFVSIGMMIDVKLLAGVWLLILGLVVFVLIARPLATGFAMILCGTPPKEARRASLLLTPMGEFAFITAQLGISTTVLSPEYYPVAVGVSILTVLITPLLNTHADRIVRLNEKLEPRWLTRALNAYSGWLRQIQSGKTPPLAWRLIKVRLIQIGTELLFITGLLIFSPKLLPLLQGELFAGVGIETHVVGYAFWALIGLLLLILVVAVWRNIAAVTMIFAESVAPVTRLPAEVIVHAGHAVGAVFLGYWLYLLLPIGSLPVWGWVIIAAGAVAVVVFFSHRLVYWHSDWQSSVQDVFTSGVRPEEARESARVMMHEGLEAWGLRLEDCVVPDDAPYADHDLGQLNLPARFGCSVIEVERNGHCITNTGPDLRIYPGDKLLLLGSGAELDAARAFLLSGKKDISDGADEFSGSILETEILPPGPRAGKTLAELQVARATGVRIVGVQRGEERFINPGGAQIVESGDHLLVVGTLNELRRFRRWLKGEDHRAETASV
ncbi:MAG: cation:proton antiporter [Opitutaceae bacterium]|nr:cation:proton antiporter [Opitutaceae bacterium]